jgi:hypothetical protein
MRHGGISRKKLGISSSAKNVGGKLGKFGPFLLGEFGKNYLATLHELNLLHNINI